MKKLALALVILTLTACTYETMVAGLTTAGEIDTIVVKTIATEYCKLPEVLRTLNRERINADITPNSIELHCK